MAVDDEAPLPTTAEALQAWRAAEQVAAVSDRGKVASDAAVTAAMTASEAAAATAASAKAALEAATSAEATARATAEAAEAVIQAARQEADDAGAAGCRQAWTWRRRTRHTGMRWLGRRNAGTAAARSRDPERRARRVAPNRKRAATRRGQIRPTALR